MRYFLLFALPLTLAAQASDSDRIVQALVSEIQQLRLALERSTLLNARTQLAVSQLQMQETTVSRLRQQLDEVRTQAPATVGRKTRLAEEIKDLEELRARTAEPDRPRIDGQLKETKLELEQAAAVETNRASRESDLAAQFQAAQNQIADSRARIAEMERALDAAIQQMLKRP